MYIWEISNIGLATGCVIAADRPPCKLYNIELDQRVFQCGVRALGGLLHRPEQDVIGVHVIGC